jgi:hypothetical protein
MCARMQGPLRRKMFRRISLEYWEDLLVWNKVHLFPEQYLPCVFFSCITHFFQLFLKTDTRKFPCIVRVLQTPNNYAKLMKKTEQLFPLECTQYVLVMGLLYLSFFPCLLFVSKKGNLILRSLLSTVCNNLVQSLLWSDINKLLNPYHSRNKYIC